MSSHPLRLPAWSLAALLALACGAASLPARAAPCAGFTDVDATSPFCPSVEWIKNRKVTLGCTSLTLYCPDNTVTRLQMAAFMQRLGTALTPVVVDIATTSAALDLDATPVVCQSADQLIADYPRRALVDASLAGTGPSGVDIGVRGVYSTNGGATWQPLNAVRPATFVPPSQWSQASDVGVLDLDVGTTVRFGVEASRVGAGSGDLSDSRCFLRTSLGSRDGSSSPF